MAKDKQRDIAMDVIILPLPIRRLDVIRFFVLKLG